MKQYIQPSVDIQNLTPITIICASVTNVQSNIVNLGKVFINTDNAR